jgi:hypothetical protein
LEVRQVEVRDRISNFADHFTADYPKPRIADLEAEVEATDEAVDTVTDEAKGALENGKLEIAAEIAQTAFEALIRLSERLDQPTRVSDRVVWEERRHIDQHSRVPELANRVQKRGAELLEGENWFAKYVDVYRSVMSEEQTGTLADQFDMEVLKTLREKGAIDLEVQITVNV